MKFRFNSRDSSVLVAMVLVIFLVGCSSSTRFKALSFLFDGVPDPAAETDLSDGDPTLTAREQMLAMRQSVRDSMRQRVRATMHPPYAEQDCSACHNLARNTSEPGSGSFAVMDFSDDEAAGFMVMPVEQLCFECHDDMTEEAATEQDMMIHDPVASGECIECHNPHRSPYPHLLRAPEVRTLCFKCHDEEIADGEDDHPELETKESCLECHNPHMSTDEYLLN